MATLSMTPASAASMLIALYNGDHDYVAKRLWEEFWKGNIDQSAGFVADCIVEIQKMK